MPDEKYIQYETILKNELKLKTGNPTSVNEIKMMNLREIYNFALSEQSQEIKMLLDDCIAEGKKIVSKASDISEEEMMNFNLEDAPNIVRNYVRTAIAASDCGCGKTNPPSYDIGNQWITATLPVFLYGKVMKCDEKNIYQALTLSALITVYLIRRKSEKDNDCYGIMAGVAAGAGIVFLHNENYDTVVRSLSNALTITAGIGCDRFKISCNVKAATAVEAGILGFRMYMESKWVCVQLLEELNAV